MGEAEVKLFEVSVSESQHIFKKVSIESEVRAGWIIPSGLGELARDSVPTVSLKREGQLQQSPQRLEVWAEPALGSRWRPAGERPGTWSAGCIWAGAQEAAPASGWGGAGSRLLQAPWVVKATSTGLRLWNQPGRGAGAQTPVRNVAVRGTASGWGGPDSEAGLGAGLTGLQNLLRCPQEARWRQRCVLPTGPTFSSAGRSAAGRSACYLTFWNLWEVASPCSEAASGEGREGSARGR